MGNEIHNDDDNQDRISKHENHAGLRLLVDIGPLIIFFAVNALQGLGPAIGALIVATGFALGVSWHVEKKIRKMPLIGGGLVLIFGGVSLILDDDFYFKIKPTVVNLLFAGLLAYAWLRNKPILQSLLESLFELDETGWRILTRNWMLFFLALAIANEIAWRNLSTDGWVTFKVFGLTGAAVLFSMSQTPIMIRHAITPLEKPNFKTGGE